MNDYRDTRKRTETAVRIIQKLADKMGWERLVKSIEDKDNGELIERTINQVSRI